MDSIWIKGGNKLKGDIPISGAKNRSGETSSSFAPEVAISSAAVMPWWPPLSS